MFLLAAVLAQDLYIELTSGSRAVTTEVSASSDVSPVGGANAVGGISLLGVHCQQLVDAANRP